MSNPFDYIQRDREEKRRREYEERQRQDKEMKSRLPTTPYDDMVRKVLGDLARVAYDLDWAAEVKTASSGWVINIGQEYGDDYGAVLVSSWQTDLRVDLEQAPDGKAKHFLCQRGGKKLRANLSADGLIEALKELYPVGTSPNLTSNQL
ncbi:MAG: hypothetical protein FJ009_18185 [Chloroflexi bacterium]|nr:hypothetical protein [Chloroflexota bacterium]